MGHYGRYGGGKQYHPAAAGDKNMFFEGGHLGTFQILCSPWDCTWYTWAVCTMCKPRIEEALSTLPPTSVATDSYVTITAHFISEDWVIVTHVLQTRVVYENHTGAHLVELLSNVIMQWQLKDKAVVLVTDNASDMIVAAQVAKFAHVRCFAGAVCNRV